MSNDKDVMTKVIEAAGHLMTMTPVKQQAAIKERFLPLLEKQSNLVSGDERKAYSKAYNIMASLHDGIRDGEVGKKELKGLIPELQEVRADLAKIAARPAKKKVSEEDAAFNDSISDSGEGRNGRLQDNGFAVLQKYRTLESTVPKRITKKFMSIQMPIVGVTDPIFFKERLSRFRLCDDTIFGYPVIKDQTVFGLNADWVAKDFKRQIKSALEDILEAYHDQTNIRMIPLGSTQLRGNVYWAWVASERMMRNLNSASTGGHFRVTGWNFPFEVKPNS